MVELAGGRVVSRRDLTLGYAAVGFAVFIWAAWIVATRDSVAATRPFDITLLRTGVPVLLLAPIWLRMGLIPKGENVWALVIMAAGWGAPFVTLTAIGLTNVEASLFGPMVPAMLPLYVAIWDKATAARPIGAARGIGLLFIAVGVGIIVGPAFIAGDGEFLAGAPYLGLAGVGWAAFTVAYRQSTLKGLEATAYVCLYSAPFLIGGVLIAGTGLGGMELGPLAWMTFSQGVLAGIGAVASFGYAVRRIGSARASSCTALVPLGAALGAWAFLGEVVAVHEWVAVFAACLGVALVNGAFAGVMRRG